jgi:catecholate siderophore receptor
MKRLVRTAVAALLSTGSALAQTPQDQQQPQQQELIVVDRNIRLPKQNQPVLDTPQSITVVTQEELNEQAITSLHQALEDVPGVEAHADEDSQQGDNFYIRGFSAENDIYVDGIRDPGRYKRDSFDMQSLEVLEGPSGVLFGRGSSGGAINYVTKLPQLDPILSSTLMFGTDATERLTADINQPIGEDAAFRINLVGYNAGEADRDVVNYSRGGIAPSISFGLGTPTRVTIEALHESEYDIPDYGVPWIYTRDEARPYWTSKFYGYQGSDFARANADMATMFVEHDLADGLTLRDRFRYGTYTRQMQVTEPGVNTLVAGPLADVIVSPTLRGVRSRETSTQNQTDVNAAFAIGPVTNDLIAGFEFDRDTTSPTTFGYHGAPNESLLDPNPSLPFPGTRYIKSIVDASAIDSAIYAIDTAKWENWELTGAARFDWFDVHYERVDTGLYLYHLDQKPTFRGALTYHPVENASLYFSYGNSFDPTGETLSLGTSTADLAPQKTRAMEVGAKYSPWKGLLLTSALFRTIEFNVRELNPDEVTYSLIGGARSEGVDLGVAGEIADHWKMWGGYEYDFATVISSPHGDLGNRLQNAPRHSARIWTSYELMDNKVEIGGGFDYIGTRTPTSVLETPAGDPYNVYQFVPSYWTIQAMVGYRVTDEIRLQVNINNLNGAKYFDGIDDNHVVPGEGRAAYLSMRVRL